MSANNKSTDESQGVWRKFQREMRSPAAFIGTTLGIIGIVLSFYFYYASLPDKNLYFFASSPTEIINKAVPSRMISVSRTDGHPIKGNVYVEKIFLWAGRDLQTRADDIREPIKISIDNGAIIDASIIMASHSDISRYGFVRKTSSTCNNGEKTESRLLEHDLNYVPLYWCVFDAKMGAAISIVYDSEKPGLVSVNGYVSGIKYITEIPEREVKANVKPGQLWSSTWRLFAYMLAGVLFAVIMGIAKELLGHVFFVGRFATIVVFLIPWVGVLVPTGFVMYQAAVSFGFVGTIATMPAALQSSD